MDAATEVMQALMTHEDAGLVMDFDGVLSPITDDPSASELLPGTEEVLAELATKLSVVALLSGRPVEFLAARACVPGVELHGSYGLEHLGADGITVVPGARPWMTAVEEATRTLHRHLDGAEGVQVEDKSLAVAVHWRRAPDRDEAEGLVTPLVQELMDTHGLHREPGKFVLELRMPLDQDKGTALRGIIAAHKLGTIAYAGDDLGDLPAFAAAAAAGGYSLVVDGPETAQGVSAIAGAHFHGPADFRSWLVRLNDALPRRSTR